MLACPVAVTVPSTCRLPARSAEPAVSLMLPPGAPEPCSDLAFRVDVLSMIRLCPALRLIRLPAPVPAPDASSRKPVRVRLLPASAVIEPPSPSRVAFTLRLLPVKVRSWSALTSTSPRPTGSLPSIVSLIITSRCAARVTTPLPPPTPVTSRFCVRASAWADSMSIVPPPPGRPERPPEPCALTGPATVSAPCAAESVVRSTSPPSLPAAPSTMSPCPPCVRVRAPVRASISIVPPWPPASRLGSLPPPASSVPSTSTEPAVMLMPPPSPPLSLGAFARMTAAPATVTFPPSASSSMLPPSTKPPKARMAPVSVTFRSAAAWSVIVPPMPSVPALARIEMPTLIGVEPAVCWSVIVPPSAAGSSALASMSPPLRLTRPPTSAVSVPPPAAKPSRSMAVPEPRARLSPPAPRARVTLPPGFPVVPRVLRSPSP